MLGPRIFIWYCTCTVQYTYIITYSTVGGTYGSHFSSPTSQTGLFSHSPPFSSRLSWICFMRDSPSPFLEQGREILFDMYSTYERILSFHAVRISWQADFGPVVSPAMLCFDGPKKNKKNVFSLRQRLQLRL